MGKLLAMAVPILPGKTGQWQQFMNDLNKRQDEFARSRRQLNVRERTFLQQTPQGDMVIVTLEGDDPEGAFRKFTQQKDQFTQWFLQQVQNVHGIDLSKGSLSMPELLIDSESGRATSR